MFTPALISLPEREAEGGNKGLRQTMLERGEGEEGREVLVGCHLAAIERMEEGLCLQFVPSSVRSIGNG